MTVMKCKFCNIVDIDYDKETKIATDIATGQKHDCPELKNKPKGYPKKWTKKEFKPVENEMVLAAINSRLDKLEQDSNKYDEAIRALVSQLKGQETLG